jgi:hypothetical protein
MFAIKRYAQARPVDKCLDHEKFYLGRAFQLLSETQHLREEPESKRLALEQALNLYGESVGLIFQQPAQTMFALVWEDVERGNVEVVEAHLARFLAAGIDERNFVLHKVLRTYHCDALKRRGLRQSMINAYRRQLQTFLAVPVSKRRFWEFYNDPILDMYEGLILCQRENTDIEEVTRLATEYITYCEATYPDPAFADPSGIWTYKNFLGFGIGSQMPGHPHGRQRLYVEDAGYPDKPGSITLVFDNDQHMKESIY